MVAALLSVCDTVRSLRNKLVLSYERVLDLARLHSHGETKSAGLVRVQNEAAVLTRLPSPRTLPVSILPLHSFLAYGYRYPV